MPYRIQRTIGGFKVVNKSTGEVHAEHTSEAKARAQVRLLNAIKHDPGFRPRGRRSRP